MSVGFQNKYKRFLPVLAITLFASIGTYFVFLSKADTNAWLPSFNTISLKQGNERFGQYAAGQEFTIPLYTDQMFSNRGNSGGPVQLVLSIALEPNHAEYKGYDCNYISPCYSHRSFGGSFWGNPRGNVKDLICLDLPDGTNNTRVNLVTLHIKALQNLSGDSQEQWGLFGWGFARGTCTTNTNAKDVEWVSWLGGCSGNVGTYDCRDGLSFGTGPRVAEGAQEGQKTGTAPTPTTTSSGGGGSTAKKQSTDSNAIPSSTAQGTENKQPDLEPSPFFDGKQYASGSDPDTLSATAFSVNGRKVAYGWIYLLIAVVTAVGGGAYWWRQKLKR